MKYFLNIIKVIRIKLELILYTIDDYLLEIQNSILSIIVGLWFFFYPYGYDTFPGTFQYLTILPDYVWGVIYLVFGFSHLISMFTTFSNFRKQIILVKSGLWAFLAITVLLANPYSLVAYFFIIFMIMTFIVFLKIQIIESSQSNK